MNSDFKGKTAFISGATSGIGEATALAFAEQGTNLILTGRKAAELNSLEKKLKTFGVDVETHVFDLTDSQKVDTFFSQIKKMDFAVNNAATEGKIADTVKLSLEDFDHVMSINVRALWLCLKKQIEFFRSNKKKGSIINLSSVAGLRGIPTSSLYVLSKHAVEGLTKSTALEQIPYGIRINSVCPGGVRTPMLERVFNGDLEIPVKFHPIGRIAEPKEIADAILWLASDRSSYVVGHSLAVDGGRTIQ